MTRPHPPSVPLLAAVASALVLAGCAAPQGAPPEPDAVEARPGAMTVPWDLVECTFVVFAVPVDPARLAPYLPEGFEPAVNARVPVDPVGATRTAFLGLEAFECASGHGLDGRVAPLEYGSFFTFVTPPDALREGTIEDYYVKWDTLVPDEPRRAALAARGIPARAGDAAVALEPAAAGGVRLSARLALEDVGGFTLTGAGREGGSASGFPFIEYAPAADGTLAAWRGVAQDRDGVVRGNGVVEVDAGTWIAEVMGTTRATVTWTGGTWTFLDGAFTHPVSAAGDVR